MAFVPADKVMEIVFKYLNGTQEMLNVFYVQRAVEWDLTEVMATFDAIIDNEEEYGNILRSNDTSLVEVRFNLQSEQSSPHWVIPVDPPIPGVDETTRAPFNCAFCVTGQTALSGRSFRARKYIGGFCANVQTASVAHHNFSANCCDYLNRFNAAMTYLGSTVGVLSRWAAKVERTTGLFTAIISWVASDLNLDSQRRRLPGRGV